MLQHADDLDFVQDTLTATGGATQLNPILNGVLAGFNRRRRHGRFKFGHQTMEIDRLRFANTASELDSDRSATEGKGRKQSKSSRTSEAPTSNAMCRFFQKTGGCRRWACSYRHRCVICGDAGRGAVICQKRMYKPPLNSNQSPERPPNPRTRRARAINV